jgi:hypothetical protein
MPGGEPEARRTLTVQVTEAETLAVQPRAAKWNAGTGARKSNVESWNDEIEVRHETAIEIGH